MKFWYCLCLLFCTYCISLLVEVRYHVGYRLENENKTDLVSYGVCFSLDNLKGLANKSEFNFDQLNVELFDYFGSRLLKSDHSELTNFINTTFLLKVKSRDYEIFDNQFCFVINTYGNYLLLLRYERLFENVVYFVYERIAKNYAIFKTSAVVSGLLLVVNKPSPYSNCKANYSKTFCLDRCVKRRFRLSSYFYHASNDTGLISFQRDQKNDTVLEHERKCYIEECYWEDCVITYFSMLDNQNPEALCRLLVFKAYPIIEEADFWFQLISLICFFSNNPLHSLLSKLIRLAKTKIKRKTKPFKVLFLFLRNAVFLFILCYGVLRGSLAVSNYMFSLDNPTKNPPKIFMLTLETLKIVICVNINHILSRCYRPDCLQTALYSNLYSNRTLQQLETETNVGLNDTVEEIHLKFLDRKMSVDFNLTNQTIFRDGQRCYQLIVQPAEPKYQRLISISSLHVKLKHSHHSSYLLPSDGVFSTDSCRYQVGYRFRKELIIRSRSNRKVKCIDHAQTFVNCFSRSNCVQRCLGRRFIGKHGNVSLQSIVDREHFSESEWSNAFLVDDRNASGHVLNECEEAFPHTLACQENNFIGSPSTDHNSNADDSKRLKFNLYYFIEGYIATGPSISKLCFELLNISGTLFGLTALGRLVDAQNWLGLKNKSCSILIYLFCLAGCTYHLFDIFSVVINGELTGSQYYLQRDKMALPELMFCITAYNLTDYDEDQLTGNRLNEMTSEWNLESVFSEIVYLNNLNVWIKLKSPDFSKDKHLRPEAFYFANKKCFSLIFNLTYSRYKFLFTDDWQVLRISFNRTMIHQANRSVHFFTARPNTMQVYRIINFHFDVTLNTSYFIRQGSFKMMINDRFEFFRNPLLLFYSLLFKQKNSVNEVDYYNLNLIKRFEKIYNRSTLRLPLANISFTTDNGNRNSYDLRINDRLFEEFYAIQREAERNSVVSWNFKREFTISDLSKKSSENLNDQAQLGNSDLELSLLFFTGVFYFTNPDSYIRLILNLLNLLHFWWDIGVLDLYRIEYYLVFVIKFLIRKLSAVFKAT